MVISEKRTWGSSPLYYSVPAGFASSPQDHYEESLNLNEYLIKETFSTVFLKADSNSMYLSGINKDDILVVDTSIKKTIGKVVAVRMGEEIVIKRISKIKDEIYFTTDSICYPPIKITEQLSVEVVGVVTHCLHNLHPTKNEPLNPLIEDIHQYLIQNPSTTFFVRVNGTSMIKAGIFDNDILIIDRSLEVSLDDIILAYIDGGFTVKRLKKNKVNFILFPENDDFPIIEITEGLNSQCWGVVTWSIHKV